MRSLEAVSAVGEPNSLIVRSHRRPNAESDKFVAGEVEQIAKICDGPRWYGRIDGPTSRSSRECTYRHELDMPVSQTEHVTGYWHLCGSPPFWDCSLG